MIYFVLDLSLTLPSPAPSMQPESSDGFASVGTHLPEERAALMPGGSFRFSTCATCGGANRSLFARIASLLGTGHLLWWGGRRFAYEVSGFPDANRPTVDRGPVVFGVSVRAICALAHSRVRARHAAAAAAGQGELAAVVQGALAVVARDVPVAVAVAAGQGALAVEVQDAPAAAAAGQTPGKIHWVTGVKARAEVQRLRHDVDAVLTGIGTVLADD